MQIAMHGKLARTGIAACIGQARAALVQLRQERLECLADAYKRRDALFVQLREHMLVLPCCLPEAHASLSPIPIAFHIDAR